MPTRELRRALTSFYIFIQERQTQGLTILVCRDTDQLGQLGQASPTTDQDELDGALYSRDGSIDRANCSRTNLFKLPTRKQRRTKIPRIPDDAPS